MLKEYMESLTHLAPERITNPDVEKAFLVENVMELRQMQENIYASDGIESTAVELEMAVQIKQYLNGKGVQESDPQYDRFVHELRELSVDKINDTAWRYGEWENPNHPLFGAAPTLGPTGEDQLRMKQRELFGRDLTFEIERTAVEPQDQTEDETEAPTEPTDLTPTDPEANANPNLEQTPEQRLAALAQAKHAAFVDKLNSPAFFNKAERDRRMEAFTQANDAYAAALSGQQAALIEQWTQAGYTPDDMYGQIHQMTELRLNADDTAQKELLVARGGQKAKLLQKYANMGTAGKAGTTLAVGAGLAGASLVLGAAAGVAGLAVGVAAGGMLVTRFTRGYLTRLSKLYKTDDKTISYAPAEANVTPQEYARQSIAFMKQTSREQIEKSEKIRKSAIIGALGAVAIGGVLGESFDLIKDTSFGQFAAGKLSGAFEWGQDRLSDLKNGVVNTPGATGGGMGGGLDTAPGGSIGGGLTPDAPSGGNFGGGLGPDLPSAGPDMPAPAPIPANPNFWSADALRIDPGEGWYKTFADMNIPENEWGTLLTKVGPQLHDNGWAYQMPNGTWGISRPGELPVNMLELIKNNR